MPTSEITVHNPKFDPELHCGAKARNGGECMQLAGAQTDHPKMGRCKFHGGKTPVKHGLYSNLPRTLLTDRIEALKRDPEALTVDSEMAIVRALLELQIEQMGVNMDQYTSLQELLQTVKPDSEEAMEAVESLARSAKRLDGDGVVTLINALGKLVKLSFEMRFARKHSIPVSELEIILEQIYQAFDVVSKRHGMSDAARSEFGEMIRNVNVSRPIDPQLDVAEGEMDYVDMEPIVETEVGV